jgi:hypothetical protein
VKRYKKYGKHGRKVFFLQNNNACNLCKFTLWSTVRGNNSIYRDNSVIGDTTLYVGNKLQHCMCKDNIKVGRTL